MYNKMSREFKNQRTGMIAKKLGTTQVFQDGVMRAAVVLDVKGCLVTNTRTVEKNGYAAVQLGLVDKKEKHTNKPLSGEFKKLGVVAKRHLVEFRVATDAIPEIGSAITADHFAPGQFVDVIGVSKGKGFQGVMKRWNFGGGRATHGNSVSHRSHGSTGNRQDPGRVFKGKKMAGHMGDRRVTVQNLQIISADKEKGLIYIAGAVPGAPNSLVMIKDSVKKQRPKDAPYPGAFEKVAK
ncbi:MAG: 50S ribosomal protein L3 [Hydrotalea sp.]|nr:50S ribosomal protein L3 [Hydrotalea sp.]